MYLPQYHRIQENDKWWGEGFTEWTNVRKSVPLYSGHIQPRIPYKYYDLSDSNELIYQMRIAAEYGVDGFSFYHYWFNGKKLLEKPIEDLLKNDEVPIDYCLCWANESWNRRWNNEEKEILIKQEYGDEVEWVEHYQYLLQFFKKKNYIKTNKCPVIIIYNERAIPCAEDMYSCWKRLALSDGFNGLHIIDVHRSLLVHELPFYGDAVMRFEPFATFHEMSLIEKESISNKHLSFDGSRTYNVLDYEMFCKKMTDRYYFRNANQYLGFFAGWDNSPRIGDRVSLIFENNTPDVFEKYFAIQYKHSLECSNNYLFINAWNEWGEGTFIEPDKMYGYGYLDSIRRVKDMYK